MNADYRDFLGIASELGKRADEISTTSAQNLRSLQAHIDALASGDLASVIASAGDDVTLEIFAPPEFPFIREARGADAFREALQTNFAAVSDQRPNVRDIFAEGDKVVLCGRETGCIKSTSLRYEVEFVDRFTFRDDKLVAVQIIVAHVTPQGSQ